uniref:Uncharacterized protein n=1 Tax=Anguilla anguilla TaxID=7936 RepID=A0A0E9WTW5_ANGAN
MYKTLFCVTLQISIYIPKQATLCFIHSLTDRTSSLDLGVD